MEQTTKSVNTKAIDFRYLLKYSGYFAFFIVALFFAIQSSTFLTPKNIINLLVQSSPLGIVACGMASVLIGGGNHVIRGGIDLSLGNNLALNVAVTAVLINGGSSFIAAFGIAFLCSVLIGIINAFAIVKLKIIPLLGTLSMMYLLQGIILLVSNNKVVSVNDPILIFIANNAFIGLPIPIWIFTFVGLIFYVVHHQSVFGNWVYAVGGNPLAARTAGINVSKALTLTYVMAAITAAIASILVTARLSGSVPGVGDIMLLDIMLAGLMSAIFSRLSVPNIPGAILSAIFVGMLSNGFTLINVPTYWVYAIKGALILAAVSITTAQQRRMIRNV
ncbi:ABC transporter permease [Neobacillus soli]|uniref:ABC transporter permease n=1 Tax=Neobacillus soli TaxID=220688 RepID=UPI0008267E05|nr:ABC transporter permease [Neobacillus soli]